MFKITTLSLKKAATVAAHLTVWVGLTYFLTTREADIDLGVFKRKDDTVTIPLLYGMFLNAVVFYGNFFWLAPRFFNRRKRYFLLAVLGILLISLLESVLDVWYGMHQPAVLARIQEAYGALVKTPGQSYAAAILAALMANLFVHPVYWCLSMAFRLYYDWSHNERARETLIREKMRAELNYLRAQINPHFLFNGINSIYHLIDKDTELAKEVLLKFSGLLRYQLYDCSSDSIALHKELEYLENYISLEKIRKGSDARIEYTIAVDGGDAWKIAPLILTPLIENAFKYLSNHAQSNQNQLSIDLSVEQGMLELLVTNTFQPGLHTPPKAGGLGLENVRQRLALLYPERHLFHTEREGETYRAQLQIQLNHA